MSAGVMAPPDVPVAADSVLLADEAAAASGTTVALADPSACTVVRMGEPETTTCPMCGKGTLRTVDFGDQQPESHQVQTFTCGHEVEGAQLKTADADQLDVERRESEDTVMPVDAEE